MMTAKRPMASMPLASGATGQFMAVVIDEVTRGTVKSVAAQLGWHNLKIGEGGGATALSLIKASGAPSFLLVDIADSNDPVLEIAEIAGLCGSGTKIVAIGLVNDVGLYRRLIDIGIADYLVKPVSAAVLSDAIQSATRGEQHQPLQAKKARVIAMIGARGGVGTTTLAASSAWTMSQEQQLRVVLLDLDLHFGSLTLSLDIEPGRGLREILSSPERIDSLLIGSAMSSVNERLRILGAEEPLEDALDVGHDGLAALMSDLGGGADCIVIDAPRALNDLGRYVLGIADAIGIVTDQSLPAMRDTQRLLSLIKSMRSDANISVIANRVGGIAGEVSRADFERGIGTKIAFCIPMDMKAANAAAERAKTLADVARTAKTVEALRSLAIGLAGASASVKPPLIKRILGL